MTREDYVSYCSKCTQQSFDSQKGLVCGLTSDIPNFDTTCADFTAAKKISVADEKLQQDDNRYSPAAIRSILLQQQDLTYAIIGGFFVAIIGALIWAIITVSINYQIGYMAIGVGALVGIGVRYFGAGIQPIYSIIGAVYSLLGCLLGNLFTQIGLIATQESLSYVEIFSYLDFNTIIAIYKDSFSPMDLLFYGIAMYEGFKFGCREVPTFVTSKDDLTPAFSNLRLPLTAICFVAIAATGYTLSKGLNGEKTYYYENGAVLSHGEYSDGELNGEWNYYYEDGTLQLVAQYVDGVEQSEWKWYHQNNSLMQVGSYKNGLLDGLWLNYYDTGILSDSSNYSIGRLQGEHKSYYTNGKLIQHGSYERDHLHGDWTFYYENGTPSSSGKYDNGTLSGSWKMWNTNGELLQETDFVTDVNFKINSAWDNKLTQTVVDGNGVYYSYYDDGTLFQSGEVKDGKKVGTWTYYFENGEKKEEGIFTQDTFKLVRAWDKQNNLMVENGNGNYFSYQPNSYELLEKGEYKNGSKEGYWESYQPMSTDIQQKATYSNGKLNGQIVSYFLNGNVLAEGVMENDKKTGEWIWYHENGTVQCTVKYVDDKKEGTQLFWSTSGLAVKEEIYENDTLIAENLL